TRVAQHFGAQVRVGVRCSVTSFGSCSNRCVRTELHLALQQTRCAAVVHYEDHEVGSLPADLTADTAALQGVHCRRSPRPAAVFAGPAHHHAAAVTATHDESCLYHGRQNHNTTRFVEQVLWNVVGHVQNFIDDGASV